MRVRRYCRFWILNMATRVATPFHGRYSDALSGATSQMAKDGQVRLVLEARAFTEIVARDNVIK